MLLCKCTLRSVPPITYIITSAWGLALKLDAEETQTSTTDTSHVNHTSNKPTNQTNHEQPPPTKQPASQPANQTNKNLTFAPSPPRPAQNGTATRWAPLPIALPQARLEQPSGAQRQLRLHEEAIHVGEPDSVGRGAPDVRHLRQFRLGFPSKGPLKTTSAFCLGKLVMLWQCGHGQNMNAGYDSKYQAKGCF